MYKRLYTEFYIGLIWYSLPVINIHTLIIIDGHDEDNNKEQQLLFHSPGVSPEDAEGRCPRSIATLPAKSSKSKILEGFGVSAP